MKSTITKADLEQFTGSTQYFHHWSNQFKYTTGVFFIAEALDAFWLLDVIASYPFDESFQSWTLHKDGDFYYLECTDENGYTLAKHDLDQTDFPDLIMPYQIYLIDGVLMLTSEYTEGRA